MGMIGIAAGEGRLDRPQAQPEDTRQVVSGESRAGALRSSVAIEPPFE